MPQLTKYRTDQRREEDGVWVDFADGIEFLIARIGNPKYEEYLRKIGKPYRHQMRANIMDSRELEQLSKKAIARHILLDWKNVTDEDGNPLPYTPEEGERVFNDPALRDIYRFVVEVAVDREFFTKQDEEEAEGNFESVSDGS